MGASIELQVTGRDAVGGLQLEIIPEFNKERMSFSKTRNTYYTDSTTMTPRGSLRGTTGKLNVLSTSAELGIEDGDIIHFKNMKNIRLDL